MRDNGRPSLPSHVTSATPRPDAAPPTADRDAEHPADPDAAALFAGPGEMRARGRPLDWAATPLGPVAAWPGALRAAVRLCLDCARPMCVFGGPALVHVYNDAYAAAVGAGRHLHAFGRPAREVWGDIWEAVGPEYAQVMAGGPAVEHTDAAAYVVDRGRGPEQTYWTWATSPVRDEDGQVVGCHTLITETTARVQAAREAAERNDTLRVSEERLRLATEAAQMYAWEFDLRTDTPAFSADAERVSGMAPAASFAENLAVVHPDDRARVTATIEAARRDGAGFDYEMRTLPPGGGTVWFRVVGTTLRDARGEPARAVGIAQNVTDRKAIELALRQSEERFRLAAEAVSAIIYDWDLTTGRVTRTRGLAEVLGHAERELSTDADAWFALVHPDDRARVLAEMRAALDGGAERYQIAYRMRHRDGTYRDFWDHGNVARDGAGRAVRVVGSSIDLTPQKGLEAALRASEERQAFLLTLSDALRAEPDADAVADRALRMLSEHLGLDRSYIVAYQLENDRAVLVRQRGNDTVPPLPDVFVLSDYPDAFRSIFDQTFVVEDELERQGLSEAERRNSGRLGMRAMVAATLRKGERRPLWSLVAMSSRPRRWTPGEIALVEEVAERTWAAVERARAEAALRRAEARYRAMTDNVPVLIWETDASGLIFSNRHYTDFFGVAFDEVRAMGWAGFVHPDDLDGYAAAYHAAFARRESYSYECRLRRADGEYRWLLTTGHPLGDERFVGFCADITERKRAEAALRASEARFRTLAELAPALLWEADPSGQAITHTTGRWREYMGQTLADAQRGGWLAAVHPEDRAHAARAFAEAFRTGAPLELEQRLRRHDGVYRWFLVRQLPVRDPGAPSPGAPPAGVPNVEADGAPDRVTGRVTRWLGLAADVHAQRMARDEAERLVRERTAERDALRRALAGAEEAERRRLARELHDQLGQHLTAFALALADTRRRLDAGEPLAGRLDHLEALARGMTRDARTLALELRPPELDDVGLVSAVETYVREWAARAGVAAEVAVAGVHEPEVPADVGSALYRILQEALTNVARHAQASQVSVIVEQPDGHVGLIVEDDGRGFDPDATAERVRRDRRLGLAGMRERAALVGGTVALESSPGAGTTLYVRLPAGSMPEDGAAADGGHVGEETAGDGA